MNLPRFTTSLSWGYAGNGAFLYGRVRCCRTTFHASDWRKSAASLCRSGRRYRPTADRIDDLRAQALKGYDCLGSTFVQGPIAAKREALSHQCDVTRQHIVDDRVFGLAPCHGGNQLWHCERREAHAASVQRFAAFGGQWQGAGEGRTLSDRGANLRLAEVRHVAYGGEDGANEPSGSDDQRKLLTIPGCGGELHRCGATSAIDLAPFGEPLCEQLRSKFQVRSGLLELFAVSKRRFHAGIVRLRPQDVEFIYGVRSKAYKKL